MNFAVFCFSYYCIYNNIIFNLQLNDTKMSINNACLDSAISVALYVKIVKKILL